MVRCILICVSVIARHIQISFKTGNSLNPFRSRLHFHLPPVVPGIKVVHIEILTGLIIDPGSHIYCSGIRICCDAAALQLAGIGAEGKDSLKLQSISVIDRDLDIFPLSVHEVFNAQIQFIIVNINVAYVIDFQCISLKRLRIFCSNIPAAVIFCQCSGTADPVIPVLRAYTLSARNRMNIRKFIFVYGFFPAASAEQNRG